MAWVGGKGGGSLASLRSPMCFSPRRFFFDMFAFTDNDKVVDQIIANDREVINKLYLQRNEPTNMTNLPSSIPLLLVVDFALKLLSLMIHKCFI